MMCPAYDLSLAALVLPYIYHCHPIPLVLVDLFLFSIFLSSLIALQYQPSFFLTLFSCCCRDLGSQPALSSVSLFLCLGAIVVSITIISLSLVSPYTVAVVILTGLRFTSRHTRTCKANCLLSFLIHIQWYLGGVFASEPFSISIHSDIARSSSLFLLYSAFHTFVNLFFSPERPQHPTRIRRGILLNQISHAYVSTSYDNMPSLSGLAKAIFVLSAVQSSKAGPLQWAGRIPRAEASAANTVTTPSAASTPLSV
jgi:hypothetical protein